MKQLLGILCCFSCAMTMAQNDSTAVKNTVKNFFASFHKQDAKGMKKVVDTAIVLQTIGNQKDGVQRLQTENFDDLVRSITNIPDSVQFEERILDYSIQIDGAMANAWTPYEFWLHNEFHHCGVNSFQLFKDKGIWKIIYLIDTRRREGCKSKPE